MKFLVYPDFNSEKKTKSSECYIPANPCPPDSTTCPYLCFSFCKEKVIWCTRPTGVGMSPSDIGGFDE